jgi:hypothetical protein
MDLKSGYADLPAKAGGFQNAIQENIFTGIAAKQI